jgi:hypothetical protein
MARPTTEERLESKQSPITRELPGNEASYTARIADARRLAESCRVVFDLERLRLNIEAGLKGDRVTAEDVQDWLEALGFTLALDGGAWVGRRKVLRHFGEGEVLSVADISS